MTFSTEYLPALSCRTLEWGTNQCLWHLASHGIICLPLQKQWGPSTFKMACRKDWGWGRDSLLQALKDLGMVVETLPYEGNSLHNNSKGAYCKNLLLKDRKGLLYLIVFLDSNTVDLKYLKEKLGAHRNFSFVAADDLAKYGIQPGGVTPFALLNDPDHCIRTVFDQQVAACPDLLNFHPLDAQYTTRITFEDLVVFLGHHGCSWEVCDFVNDKS